MNRSEAHKILGTTNTTSGEDLKKAYRKLAMLHHPDRNGDQEMFKKVKAAFEFLESGKPDPYVPPQSAKYEWEEVFKKKGPRPPIGDLDENTIGQMSGAAFQKSTPSGGAGFGKKRTFDATITITIEEAFNGCTKNLRVPNETLTDQPIQVMIPAGSAEGNIIRDIETKFDTYRIYIKIESDYTIKWGLRDLHLTGDISKEISVSPFIMMTGGFHNVECIDGKTIQIRIPPGLTAGKFLKIKDAGYWKTDRCHERGSAYLRVIPDIKKLSEYSKEELKQFKKELDGCCN